MVVLGWCANWHMLARPSNEDFSSMPSRHLCGRTSLDLRFYGVPRLDRLLLTGEHRAPHDRRSASVLRPTCVQAQCAGITTVPSRRVSSSKCRRIIHSLYRRFLPQIEIVWHVFSRG